MASTDVHHDMVTRTERGLVIAGTRITLYAILDYLQADWPPTLIQQWLNVTDEQMDGVLDYIQHHRTEVEEEYKLVLRTSEENRRYWDEHNRERFAGNAARTESPSEATIRAKLRERKAQLGIE